MAYIFMDNHICSRCGCSYEWRVTIIETGEAIFGEKDRMYRHVKNWDRINSTDKYSIETECPNCGNREHVVRNR